MTKQIRKEKPELTAFYNDLESLHRQGWKAECKGDAIRLRSPDHNGKEFTPITAVLYLRTRKYSRPELETYAYAQLKLQLGDLERISHASSKTDMPKVRERIMTALKLSSAAR